MKNDYHLKNRDISFIPSKTYSQKLVIFAGGEDNNDNLQEITDIRKILSPYIKRGEISAFNIMSISCGNWDSDYSPWKEEIGERMFEGNADIYFQDLKYIIDHLKDNEGLAAEPDSTYIIGYSLAGLASLYSITLSDMPFRHCACVSGSLWYPGFIDYLEKNADALHDSIGKKDIEKLVKGLSKMDKKADIQKDKKGNVIYDKDSKDVEIVKYQENIADYMAREVLPHLPDAKAFFEADDENAIFEEDCGRKTIKIGAEIPFTRYFYKYQQPTPSEELKKKFLDLENFVDDKIKKLFGAA